MQQLLNLILIQQLLLQNTKLRLFINQIYPLFYLNQIYYLDLKLLKQELVVDPQVVQFQLLFKKLAIYILLNLVQKEYQMLENYFKIFNLIMSMLYIEIHKLTVLLMVKDKILMYLMLMLYFQIYLLHLKLLDTQKPFQKEEVNQLVIPLVQSNVKKMQQKYGIKGLLMYILWKQYIGFKIDKNMNLNLISILKIQMQKDIEKKLWIQILIMETKKDILNKVLNLLNPLVEVSDIQLTQLLQLQFDIIQLYLILFITFKQQNHIQYNNINIFLYIYIQYISFHLITLFNQQFINYYIMKLINNLFIILMYLNHQLCQYAQFFFTFIINLSFIILKIQGALITQIKYHYQVCHLLSFIDYQIIQFFIFYFQNITQSFHFVFFILKQLLNGFIFYQNVVQYYQYYCEENTFSKFYIYQKQEVLDHLFYSYQKCLKPNCFQLIQKYKLLFYLNNDKIFLYFFNIVVCKQR